MRSTYVLDASAVLAWILREPGSDRVLALMQAENCVISSVNAAEVVSRLADGRRSDAVLRDVIGHLGVEVIAFDAQQATEAGLLRPITRHLGLSLGDRACLALTRLTNATVVTADRAWMELAQPLEISIEFIRPAE